MKVGEPNSGWDAAHLHGPVETGETGRQGRQTRVPVPVPRVVVAGPALLALQASPRGTRVLVCCARVRQPARSVGESTIVGAGLKGFEPREQGQGL